MPVEQIAVGDVRAIERLRFAGLLTCHVGIRIEVAASTVRLTRLQQWNPERYGNGTIEDWEITVFSEPFEDLLKT